MSPRLLIVDDDEIIRFLAQDDLEQCGYAVETAKDGLAAWEKIDRDPSRFDLMLLDKQMPRLDGIALLKRLKADKRFSDLPVIMMTCDSRPEDIAEGLAAGAFHYLTKPSAENVLRLVIKNALDESLQKRELRAQAGSQANNLNLLNRADFCCRTLEEARSLALLLADASMSPERTVNGYSELLINAVEHGNLCISYAEKSQLLREDRWVEEVEARLKDSRYSDRIVHITLEKTATASIVTIADQGLGFDWQAYTVFSPERVFDLHGRGIAISKAASFDHLEYLGSGSCVVATVLLPGSSAQPSLPRG